MKTEIRLLEQVKTEEIIDSWFGNGKGNSFVRAGDGEGMVLSCPKQSNELLWRHMKDHLGPAINENRVEWISTKLREAIQNADLIGLRDDIVNSTFDSKMLELNEEEFMVQFKAAISLRESEQNLRYPGALRIALISLELDKCSFASKTEFTSIWMPFELSASGYLIRLAQRSKKIGIISSRSEAARLMTNKFRGRMNFYRTPDIYGIEREVKLDGEYFWQNLKLVYDLLDDADPDCTYFVGAGIWGKLYCEKIRQIGGIAIDIGAVFDSWSGMNTRGVALKQMFNHKGNSAPDFLRLENQ